MCPTLERIMAPEIEEGKRQGIRQGILTGKVIAYAEMGMSVEDIADRVSLSVAEVKGILDASF